jgi:glycosyltransferase involved in cell wall biosynthesis
MKIAYVTTYDAQSLGCKTWRSGHYIGKKLQQQGISVEYIGSLKEKYSSLFRAKTYLYRLLLNKRYLRDREPVIVKDYAKQVSRRLAESDADLVMSPGIVPIAYLECIQPIVFWTDATFAGMLDFFPEFSDLCEETVRKGNSIEQAALDRCRMAIFSSQWAAQTAIDNYRIDLSKIKVVPFGANIEGNRTDDDIKAIVHSRPSHPCKLLFVGVDWYRKGGDKAVKIAEELNKRGLETEVTVVGCQPPLEIPMPDFVHSLGYIDTSTTQGLGKMSALYGQSHFLILPTRADCAPNVLREANSFGVPGLSTNIAGIPMTIRDGCNGKVFSKDANYKEYCDYVSNLMLNYARYKKLALSSFQEYEQRLNWSVAVQAVEKMLIDIIGSSEQ